MFDKDKSAHAEESRKLAQKEHDAKDSKSVAQREKEAQEAKEAEAKKVKAELPKEESERRKAWEGGKLSGTIRRVAADLMEQTDRRARVMIERDIDTGTSDVVQRFLILAILQHLDGKLTVSENEMPYRLTVEKTI